MMPDVMTMLTALGLTLAAGLSTLLGGVATIFTRRENARFLSYALGLSAGVMIYLAFMELLPEAAEALGGAHHGLPYALLAFFGGVVAVALIDHLMPGQHCPHKAHEHLSHSHPLHIESDPQKEKLKRSGIALAIAVGIHNIPEGMATFMAALDGGLQIALPIVVAIALHNIPVGLAVWLPIHQATGSRRKAFWYTLATGMAEPVGALLGMLVLLPFWTATLNAACLAAVAGVMVYISFDELIPSSECRGNHHLSLLGIFSGMALMALSLALLH